MSIAYCVKEQKPCVLWIEKYFKDCLCNLKDEFSFGFGLISLVCWGVAEIPQIITNFRTKSSHGVSLLFLITWVLGDVFNLVGCLLEPATLPTQFYTALASIHFEALTRVRSFLVQMHITQQLHITESLCELFQLYATGTVVLALQGFYYDHFCRWWKCQKVDAGQRVEDDDKKPLKPPKLADSGIPIPNASPGATPRREYYYTSARSMASSGTPPFRSYLKAPRSGPSATGLDNESSSDDEATPVSAKPFSPPRPISRSAGYGTFLATSLNLSLQSKALRETSTSFTSSRLSHEGSGTEHSAFGQWLGWLMAAIYMSGRIPQIWLNIKRGSVEGLNPLMFIFAIVANLTYVLSILVRTTEWDRIKANMPWLLDAAACVALDLFIVSQYIYYRSSIKKGGGMRKIMECVDAKKTLS